MIIFEPGQRVVCIDVDGASQLTLKAIYTVKQVRLNPCFWRQMWGDWNCVSLYETEPDPPFNGFCSERFRLLPERATDISVFTAMLTDTEVNA